MRAAERTTRTVAGRELDEPEAQAGCGGGASG